MQLREYQQECISTIDAQPPGSYLVQMATGLGKTVTFANIPRHGRVLIIAHREELVYQPAKYYDCPVGFEMAKHTSNGEEVVIASVQSLARRLDRFSPHDFDMLITDECHHAAARTYKEIYNHFHPRLHLGFSATVARGDNAVEMKNIPEWAELAEEIVVDNVERPLFGYFRTPVANKADPNSGIGISMYADAVELIRQADVQWERIQWEFKSGERKIFGEQSQTNLERFGKDRLYAFGPFFSENGDLLHEFSPEYRDSNLYAGFQNILKQIEFNVGLAFGTISDPMSVERTATEIESTRQRMFTTIEGIKHNLESTLDGLIYAMSVMAGLYGVGSCRRLCCHL